MTELWQRLPSGRLGAGWMIVAAFCFATMGVFVKLGKPFFSPAELLFYRTLIGFTSVSLVVFARRQPVLPPNWGAHLKRSFTGYAAIVCLFYAITELPLATAVTLNYTSTLFFALICVLWLREKLTGRVSVALLIGFAGIVTLLRPSFDSQTWLAALVGLMSGFFAGASIFQVRELGQMGEPEWRTVWWFTGVSTLLSLVWLVFHRFSPISSANVWILAGLGASATAGQLAMTRAYKEGRKFLAASFGYLTVVFSALMGWGLWGDVVSFEGLLAMGAIVLSGLIAARRG
ncbi:DMT family transporter [Crenobacter cavernae]|nr:DMT family transporter [Crenobacter cavernae]